MPMTRSVPRLRPDARRAPRRRPGFTIVELLVVISVIGVLMGLLLPALSGARKRSKKLTETNSIRQVGVAWNLYATSNRDAALPGYLPVDVQVDWKLAKEGFISSFDYPDGSPIRAQYAQPWTWRLMSYLDYNDEVIHGHLDDEFKGQLGMSVESYDGEEGTAIADRPRQIAQEPGFGYNAFYVGGWWRKLGEDVRAQPYFSRARGLEPEGTGFSEVQTKLVVQSPSNIRDAAKLILFCSSTVVPQPPYETSTAIDNFRPDDQRRGSHYVMAPTMAQQEVWGARENSNGLINIVSPFTGGDAGDIASAVPIGRYTGQVSALHADLHTSPNDPAALDDQRFWINPATRRYYTHTLDP